MKLRRLIITIAVFAMMLSLLAGCGKEKQVVLLGAADTLIAKTVGEMYAQVLETKDYRVERRFEPDHGDMHSRHNSLRDGNIDLYLGYTGDEIFMFDVKPLTDPYSIYDQLKAEFDKDGITLLEPIPANNAYTLAVLSEKATAEKFKTYGDVFAKASGLKIAVTEKFKNGKEGFGILENSYGPLSFAEVITVDEKDLYTALDSKKVDVAVVSSDDGFLSDTKYKALRDSFHAFVPQIITPIVKKSYIEQNPAIRDTLNEISSKLNDKAVIELNRQLTIEKKDYKEVAKGYLQSVGIIKK